MTTSAVAMPSASAKSDAMARPSPTPRGVVAMEWTALAALVGLFLVRGLLPAWKQLNSDFPNYYLSAKLLVAGAPLERMYDWIWFQRQKDHAGLDWGIVSYGPLTPFSATILAPLTGLSALAAKRCWLVVNLALLAWIVALLHAMTRLSLRRVALVTFLTVVPLRTNFDFGQQYVLILFLLVLAGHLHLRGRSALSGAVVALATVLKIYPAIFVLFFVVKRRWSALFGFGATFVSAIGVGLLSFGGAPLEVYWTSVLPRISGGEVHDPYYLPLNSTTVLLRRLFVFEPDLNPHPLVCATLGYVLLQPIVQALLLTTSLWFIVRRRGDTCEDALHWGALAALSLVLSTGASTYHFCGLVLATVVAVAAFARAGRVRLAVLIAVLHALVCAPLHRLVPAPLSGWQVFLGVPRLYALLAYWSVFLYGVTKVSEAPETPRWEAVAFCLLFFGAALAGALVNLRHFDGLASAYATRIGANHDSLLVTAPAPSRDGVYFTRMDDEGYSLAMTSGASSILASRGVDLLHPTIAGEEDEGWVEVSARQSGVARFSLLHGSIAAANLPVVFADAEQPAVSRDGQWLSFIREENGRGTLWIVDVKTPHEVSLRIPKRIVDSSYDVLDAAVSSNGDVVFSASHGEETNLFTTHVSGGDVTSLDVPGRYPSFSPDGRRLAYSHEDRGTWQVETMKLGSRERHRITRGDCNSLKPAWTLDGTRLVYASDCGRGLGATALCEALLSP